MVDDNFIATNATQVAVPAIKEWQIEHGLPLQLSPRLQSASSDEEMI